MTKPQKRSQPPDLVKIIAYSALGGGVINLLLGTFLPILGLFLVFMLGGAGVGVLLYMILLRRFLYKQLKPADNKPPKQMATIGGDLRTKASYVRPQPGVHTALTITTQDGLIVGTVNGHASSLHDDISVRKEPSGKVIIRNGTPTPIMVTGYCHGDLTTYGNVNVSNTTWNGKLTTAAS